MEPIFTIFTTINILWWNKSYKTDRERGPKTLTLRIICEPIVIVGKLNRERRREHKQRKRRMGVGGSVHVFSSPSV